MKKTMIAAAVLVLALALSFLFAGCGAAPASACGDKPVAVALLIGNHANSKTPNVMSAAVRQETSRAVKTYGYITVISVDGDPTVVLEGSCDIDERYKDAAPQRLNQDNENRTAEILAFARQVRADTPEVDTLAALRLAERSLASAPEESEKVIIVVDSCFNTTGLCNFANNLLYGDPQVIAENLYEQRAIPDLTGTKVLFQQMGDVAAPQQALSPRQVEQLTAIWQAIVEKGGGSFVLDKAQPLAEDMDSGLPEVSVVRLAAEVPLSFTPESAVTQELSFAEPFVFTEKQFRFAPDSVDLLDPSEAETALLPVAEHMAAHPELTLLLAGTTAGDEDSEFDRSLSLGRASTVRDILVSFGVDRERLIVIGLGCSDPWHIRNAGTQGELAAQNRKVVLLDASAEIAQELQEGGTKEPPS